MVLILKIENRGQIVNSHFKIRIDEIKEELQSIFKKEVDFVPDSNNKIMKDLIYV